LAPRALLGGDLGFAAQQDELGLIAPTLNGTSPAASAARNMGSEATSNGKVSDPAVANSYTQAQATIASDSELSAALRMAENAGDKTFRDRFASIISDLELDPGAALDAIQKEVFGSKVRASTSGTAADAVAFAAIWRAVNRLHELRPDLGIIWSREAGFRPAVALAEEQRHVLHSIAANPNLTFQEKLDRMADAGLFDAPLASVLAGIGGFGNRSVPLGPADRPGGGGRSRIPRNLVGRIEAAAGREVTRKAERSAQTADDLRNSPGVGAGFGQIVRGTWWSEIGEVPVPRQVADQLRGREFRDWPHFRQSFWQAVADVPELAGQFNSQNRRLMAQGNAPFAIRSHYVGRQKEFHLHHVQRLTDGGAMYDVDNIRLASPLQHHQIHYGRSP
jgi:hypothetical protein